MNVLIIGSGGREHALSWKIAQSPRLTKMYIAPGNAGTALLGENVNLSTTDFEQVGMFALKNHIDMIIVGPEEPLVRGIHDFFSGNTKYNHIMVMGPTTRAAMLEGSKDYAKNFMQRYHIPTADFQSFTNDQVDAAISFLQDVQPPYVLKADGLAAGILRSLHDPLAGLRRQRVVLHRS